MPEQSPPKPITLDQTKGPPIFVVGNGRSGTTLMELMLSAHPRIYISHEAEIYRWLRAGRSLSAEEFLEGYFKTMNFRWLRLRPETVMSGLPYPLERDEVWMVLDRIMRLKAASLGRVRYGDKTPGHIVELDSIFRDFPDARVIFMVRDPRTLAQSVTKMPWGSAADLPNCWINEVWHRKAEKHLDKLLLVRLEDLQREPRREMERTLEFVGEEWNEAVLDHSNHIPDHGSIPDMPWFKSSGRAIHPQNDPWNRFTSERIRLIERICHKSMELYGYEPANLDNEPGRLKIVGLCFRQLPETLRYGARVRNLLRTFRNIEAWDWENAGTIKRLNGLNPQCWQHYPGYVWPKSPEPMDLDLVAAVAEPTG